MKLTYKAYYRPIRYLALYVVACALIFKLVEFCESWYTARSFGVPFQVTQQFKQRSVGVSVDGKQQEGQLSYRFRPPRPTVNGESVPLVIFLHGSGQRGSDNVQQLVSIPTALCDPLIVADFPCAIVVPQCPKNMTWTSGLAGGSSILSLLDLMCDEVLQDARLDSRRVYLIGYSMGAFGAWSWAARSPERFAGIVPIAGGGDPRTAFVFVDSPVWAVHGAEDDVVSVEQTRAMVNALREAGGVPRYSEIVGLGHKSWREIFSEDSAILRWLFGQKLVQTSPSSINLQHTK